MKFFKNLKWIYLGAILLGLSLGIIGLFVYQFDFTKIHADATQEKYYTEQTKTFTATDKITIDVADLKVTVTATSEPEFCITYYEHSKNTRVDNKNNWFESESPVFRIRNFVRFSDILRSLSWGIPKHGRVNLSVPTGFTGQLEIIGRDSPINLNGIKGLERIKIVNVDGGVSVTDCQAGVLDINCRGGNITVNGTFTKVETYCRDGHSTVTLKGFANNYLSIYAIELYHRDGHSRLMDAKQNQGVLRQGDGTHSVKMTVRDGRNNLYFVD
ncbi:MAG: hypothetical protein LBG88_04390 [Christensenellaceae bacterium]|jgi:hypothetical protein|nr:hypothetical protein [Christensenellaceae bacterium]